MRAVIRWGVCLAVVLIGSASVSVAQSHLNLLDAVERFQAAWGVDISYASSTLEGLRTKWARPVATDAESDMELLLQGTCVTFIRQPSGTFILESPVSTLAGIVRAQDSGIPLRGAHIYFAGTSEGTTSDPDGDFTLTTTRCGPARIAISHVGYLSDIREVELLADSTLLVEIRLSEWVIQERGFEVTATPLPSDLPLIISAYPSEMDTRESEDLKQPTGLGTAEVPRNVGDIAGLYVDPSNSDIHMQGGGLGEHQFQLDGSKIFEPVRLGLFGLFNPSAISHVTVRKAGYDVEWGSYLDGIINAEHSIERN